jgi:hypothetical protein
VRLAAAAIEKTTSSRVRVGAGTAEANGQRCETLRGLQGCQNLNLFGYKTPKNDPQNKREKSCENNIYLGRYSR